MVLIKVTVPNAERDKALRNLRTVNITHFSLFPDLDGAAKYCNVAMQVDTYVSGLEPSV
jgi:hypothetical protein